MRFEEFRALFDGGVKAMLDWDALVHRVPSVEEAVLTGRESIGGLLTVWYVAADGSPGDWRDADSHPQTVAEAARAPQGWPRARAERIAAMRRQFEVSAEPLVFLVPAYSVDGRMLVLDVSHRIVAGYLSGVPMRVLVLCVKGPVEVEILPDLGRWHVP